MKPFVHPDIIKDATDEPIMDYNFDPDREINTGIFRACYTMEDNRRTASGWYIFQLKGFPKEVLN